MCERERESVCVCMCVCVCVCVCGGTPAYQSDSGWCVLCASERERETERESVCVCVCVEEALVCIRAIADGV